MKKIMIALGVVASAFGLQAATVSWQSGALYTAANEKGGWSSTLVNQASPQALVTMSVYLVNETTYKTVSAMDQKGKYNWASDQTATYTALNMNADRIIGAATVTDTAITGGVSYYSIITMEYTDTTYGKMYMATAASVLVPSSGTATISNIFGGQSTAASGGVRDWQPVPEPTSGLLALLGMAGLTLRRRRA